MTSCVPEEGRRLAACSILELFIGMDISGS